MGKLISVKEAAERLGVTAQTIKNWAKDGNIKLKGMGKGGRAFWVSEDVINALADTDLAETERMKAQIKEMHQVVHDEWKELMSIERDYRNSLRLANYTRPDRFRMTEFLKSYIYTMHFLDVINDREKDIFECLVNGNDIETVGEKFGLSASRIMQIYIRSCRKIGNMGTLKKYVDEAEDAKRERDELRCVTKALREKLECYEAYRVEQQRLRKMRDEYGEELQKEYEHYNALVELLGKRLVDCELSVRSLCCLKAANVETIGELVQWNRTDLLKLRNFGRKSLTELDDFLEGLNLSFNMDVDSIVEKRENLCSIMNLEKEEKNGNE